MVGRSSGALPTRVQILVLAPFPGFIPELTSRISRSAGAQYFGGAHWGRVCVRVFIEVSVCVVSVCVVLCNFKKMWCQCSSPTIHLGTHRAGQKTRSSLARSARDWLDSARLSSLGYQAEPSSVFRSVVITSRTESAREPIEPPPASYTCRIQAKVQHSSGSAQCGPTAHTHDGLHTTVHGKENESSNPTPP
jgi:hypothetical protein